MVEDDPELSDFLRYLLEQEKYDVISATDGEMGLEKARTERPEIILLDVLLPKVHGYEVCDRLRQDPATCLIPIMMVTSLTSMKDRLTGIKLGADEYVSKPFEPVELLARVERLITRSRQNLAANPLTGLAGGVTLEQEIKRRLGEKPGFTVGFCDVNGLKSYNEVLGFEKGDGVIRLAGTILKSALNELGNRDDLVVHLGGDDFAFVTTPSHGEVVATRALENWESLIPLHYDEKSRQEGALLISKPEGEPERRRFLTLSIGLVDVTPGLYQHHAQVLDRARQALALAKKNPFQPAKVT